MLPTSQRAIEPSSRDNLSRGGLLLCALSALIWTGCTGPSLESDVILLDQDQPTGAPPVWSTGDTGIAEEYAPLDPNCTNDDITLEMPDLDAPGVQPKAMDGGFSTGVDFDFDREGRLITSVGNQLVSFTHDGRRHVFNIFLSDTPAGLRFLPDGDLLMAMPNLGSIRRLDADTGLLSTVLAGMSYPYGLEVAKDGTIFAAEHAPDGRVFMVDPFTGDTTVVAQLPFPLTLALSADENVLYISSSTSMFSDVGRIAALDREPSGDWGTELRFIYGNGQRVDAMTSDACGNLYVGSWSGQVFRIRASDGGVEPLVDLPIWGLYAARFGASYGGFSQTQLYLTDSQQIFALELGVEGRHILAP